MRKAGFTVSEGFGTYDRPYLVPHGMVGVLANGPGPTLLIRGDMDALPVKEET